MVSVYRFSFSDNPQNSARALSTQLPAAPQSQRFAIEVEDNGDGLLDANDHYTYTSQSQSYALQSREGLALLNYSLNPETLRRMQIRGSVERREANPSPQPHSQTLDSTHAFSSAELYRIRRSESVWSLNDTVDTRVLLGQRTFRPDENAQWSRRFSTTNPVRTFLATPGGIHISDRGFYLGDWGQYLFGDMNWNEMRGGQIVEKVVVGMTFGALSFAASANATWHTFSTNFTSNRLGRILMNVSAEDRLAQLTRDSGSAEANLQQNIATVDERTEMARGNLYFGFTDPVVAVACAADMDFWRWAKQAPTANFGPYSILGLWGRNISTSLGALTESAQIGFLTSARAAMGLSDGLGAGLATGFRGLASGGIIAASAFLSLYETSQIWYAFYGHLPYRSPANKIFSAGSTVLSEAWILARASSELRNITQTARASDAVVSGALNWANLARASRVLTETGRSYNVQFFELFRDFGRNFPLAHLLTRRIIDPSLRELSINLRQAATNLQQANVNRETISAIIAGTAARTRFMNVLNNFSPRLLNGHLTRQAASAANGLLKAQRALLLAAENAEAAGKIGRVGRMAQWLGTRLAPYSSNFRLLTPVQNILTRMGMSRLADTSLQAVRMAAQSARALLSASEATLSTARTVVGVTETLGAEIGAAEQFAVNLVRSGGVPEIMGAAEGAVEAQVASTLGQVAEVATTAVEAGVEMATESLVAEGAGSLALESAALTEMGGAATAMAGGAETLAVSTAVETSVAAAAESAVVAAEAITAGAAAEVGLVVASGLAIGAGIGTAFAYGVGIYDESYTPRDAWSDFRSMLFD